MYPNEALARLQEAMSTLEQTLPGSDVLATTHVEDAAVEVLEAFEALNTWLSKGGFKPDAWHPEPDVAARMVDEHTTAVTIAGVFVHVRDTPNAVVASIGVDGLPYGKTATVESWDGMSWEHELPYV